MEGMQPDECTPEVSWEVRYFSDQTDEPIAIARRKQDTAIDFAEFHRSAGRRVKLYRVEKTEVDF